MPIKPWHLWKYSVTSQTPAYMGLEKGEDQGKEGEDCHWSTWGQLPVDDGQGSWHQDVWQRLDGPH